MKYEIKIENAVEEEGKIDFRRLSNVSSSILNIAEGALQIRLTGTSFAKGRKVGYLNEALVILFSGIRKGSTIIELECNPFDKALQKVYPDFFNQNIYEELLSETPISLVVKSFNDALNENSPKDYLDKSLLKELKNFSYVLKSPSEKISIVNQGSINELSLNKKDFEKIEVLEKQTPEPQSILLNGKVDVLEYSRTRVKIITKDGIVEAFLTGKVKPSEIRNYWGEEVTISGTAHYKQNGKISYVEINRIFSPGQNDTYFSVKSIIETTEQQIDKQLRERGYKNRFGEIVGKWPGDENIDQLLNMLTK